MATYNKRGGKIRKKKEIDNDIEILEEESTTAEVFSSLDEGANRTEEWVAKNSKFIYIILGSALLIALGVWAYQNLIVRPNQEKAVTEMVDVNELFQEAGAESNITTQDSLYKQVLSGRNGNYGVIDIAEKYGNTAAGNQAHYMAGIAYLRTGQYKKAVEQLQQFDGNGTALDAIAQGAIGDAFAQIDDTEEAYNYYKRAVAVSNDNFTASKYSYKAGIMALELGKNDEARELFNTIKEDYSDMDEATKVDIYLGQLDAQ